MVVALLFDDALASEHWPQFRSRCIVCPPRRELIQGHARLNSLCTSVLKTKQKITARDMADKDKRRQLEGKNSALQRRRPEKSGKRMEQGIHAHWYIKVNSVAVSALFGTPLLLHTCSELRVAKDWPQLLGR